MVWRARQRLRDHEPENQGSRDAEQRVARSDRQLARAQRPLDRSSETLKNDDEWSRLSGLTSLNSSRSSGRLEPTLCAFYGS